MTENATAAFSFGDRHLYPGVEIQPVTKTRRLFIMRAWVQMSIIDCRLKFTRFEAVHKWIVKVAKAKTIHKKDDPSLAPKVIDDVNRAIDAASKFYYRQRKDCLPKAILAFYLMRQLGLPVELCFGVRKFPFKGHAWIEFDGRVVFTTPADLPSYKVIMRIA